MAEGGKRRRPARIGGYDADLSMEPLRDDLICAICTGILRDPMMVNPNKCGHTYCRGCIEQQMRASRTCPNCRDPIPEDGCIVKAPPMVQRMVKGIKVRCRFAFGDQNDFPHGKPCGWEGDLGDFDGHVDGKCFYGEKECVQGCGEFIARILAVRHEQNDCNQTDVVCVFPGCGAKMKRCQLEEHMAASATVHFIPLFGMVTGLKEKVETLEQNEINLQATIVALQEQAATHQQHEEALKVTVEALDKTVAEHRQKETDLNAMVKSHERSLMKQQEEEVLLKATLETLEGKQTALTATVQAYEQNLEMQKQKETALTAAVQGHGHSLETQKQKEMMLAAAVEKLQGKVATHDQKNTALKTTLETLQEKVETQVRKETVLAATMQAYDQNLATQQKKETELQAKVENLLQKAAAQEQSVAKLKPALQGQQRDMTALQGKMTNQEQKQTVFKTTLETVQRNLAMQAQSVARLEPALQTQQQNVTALQEEMTTQKQKETARETKLEALQREVATQEQTHGRQAAVLQGKVTTLKEKERELDVSVKDLLTLATPDRLLRLRILRSTASHLHQFKNALRGTISSDGKSYSFRVVPLRDPLVRAVDITGALEVGKPLEMTILRAASALTHITCKFTSSQGRSTELRTREVAVQSKVRVMLSKDRVLAVLRCGDDAPSCKSGWPLDAPTTVQLSLRVTGGGEYAINLF